MKDKALQKELIDYIEVAKKQDDPTIRAAAFFLMAEKVVESIQKRCELSDEESNYIYLAAATSYHMDKPEYKEILEHFKACILGDKDKQDNAVADLEVKRLRLEESI